MQKGWTGASSDLSRGNGVIKRQFSRKADLKELITTESALQEMEKDFFNEKEGHWLLTRKHMEEYTSLER